MIYYFSPYSTEKKLGAAYNAHMALIPNDYDWGVLMDGDCMFLTDDYGTHLQRIVDKYHNHNVGIFTALTNRVGNVVQCHKNLISQDPNIINHRKIALALSKQPDHITQLHDIISGHFMMVQKKVWNACKFKEDGILAVDNNFSRKVLNKGFKIYLIQNFYVLHYYRLLEGRSYKNHLK